MVTKNNSIIKKVFLIFIFGLLLRLGYVLFFPQIDVHRGDSFSYKSIAENILVKHSYSRDGKGPDVFWAPGYPLFISGVYKIFGMDDSAVRIIQSLLSALVILMVYYLGKKIFNANAGIFSAMITAVYPGFIGYSGLLLPQVLSMFLTTLFIFLIIKFNSNMKLWLSLVLGFIAGYSSLVRAELFLFWTIFLLTMPFIANYNKRLIKFLIMIFITMCFVISLWTIRNYRVFGKPILISVHYGDLIWYSTWKGEWLEYRDEEPYVSIGRGLGQVEAADAYFKAGINNIKEHPFIYLKMCIKRLYRFWLTGHSNIFYFMRGSFLNYLREKAYFIFFIKLIMLFLNVSLILLGFLGIKIAYVNFTEKRKILSCILLPILFFVTLHFFLFATPRYAIPIMPFIIIFSSCGIIFKLGKIHI